MTQEDRKKIEILLSEAVNPDARRQVHIASISKLMDSPDAFSYKTVKVKGLLVFDRSVESKARYIYIQDKTGAIPGLFYGTTEGVDLGNEVEVTGVFNKEANAIDADKLEKKSLESWVLSDYKRVVNASFIILGIAAIVTIVCEGFFIIRRWRYMRALRKYAAQ